MMNDTCLSLLFRPPSQQWIVFSVLSASVILSACYITLLPEWRRYQYSEQRYLQQRRILTEKRQQYAELATPEQLRILWQSDHEGQKEKGAGLLEQLLSPGQRKVIRWRNGAQPVELQLELRWPDVTELFLQMAQLNPPMYPGRFSLENRSESDERLQLAIWLNLHE